MLLNLAKLTKKVGLMYRLLLITAFEDLAPLQLSYTSHAVATTQLGFSYACKSNAIAWKFNAAGSSGFAQVPHKEQIFMQPIHHAQATWECHRKPKLHIG